jgi:hypothetical protein
MVEEADSRGNLGRPASVEIQLDRDIGFVRLAVNLGSP